MAFPPAKMVEDNLFLFFYGDYCFPLCESANSHHKFRSLAGLDISAILANLLLVHCYLCHYAIGTFLHFFLESRWFLVYLLT